jgi:hypothetical protein
MSSLLPPSFDLQDGDKNGLRVFRGLPPQAGCPSCCYSVVVNADDLGYCDERDRGIVEAFKGGVVTSTSVYNAPAPLPLHPCTLHPCC